MVNLHEQHPGFTPSELRSKLVDNINRHGIKEKLKSQLRSKLFAELSLATKIPSVNGKSGSPESNLLIVKVADSMFVEYLQSRGFDFTLSVFLPESGLDNPSRALGEKDLLRALHLDTTATATILLGNVDNIATAPMSSSLLLRLLESVSSLYRKSTLEKEVQTNVEVDDLLHIKLRDMDKTIRSRTVQYDQSQTLLLEERMYSFQREIEENNQLKLQQQIESFKKIELAKAKLEEKNYFQAEFQRQRIEFEQKIMAAQSKSVELITEERERMAVKEREMDRQNLLLKQQMLDEHNNIVIKEKQLRNESEFSTRQIAMERDQLRKRVEEVQDQLEKLTSFKEKYTQKMEESMSQYKIDLNKEYSSLFSTVEVEKAKIAGERMLLDEKKNSLDKMIANASKVEQEAERLRLELSDTVGRLGEAVRTRDTLLTQVNELQLQVLTQKGSSTLEFEISSLKRQLASTEQAAAQRQQEYEAMINSLSANRVGSDADVIVAKQNEMKWKQKCQELIGKLDNEFVASDELARKLDRERLRNKELERELADTRLLLHQSQAALKLSTTATETVDFSSYSKSKGATMTDKALTSSAPDPLYERYAKITSSLEKPSSSKIPLPSQFEEFSNSSISPLRQSSLSFREDFLTPQELELLKRGKIPLEYENDDPIVTSTPPKSGEKMGDILPSPPKVPFKTLNAKNADNSGSRPPSMTPPKKQADISSNPLQPQEQAPKVPPKVSQSTEEEDPSNQSYIPSIKEQEVQLERLAQERKEAEIRRKQVEQDLQKQFEKEQELLAKERERVEEMEREEKAKAAEFAKLKESQEQERKRLAEIERVREEERRREVERLEKEKKKKEEEMKGIAALENDPVLQKYMAIVAENKTESSLPALKSSVVAADDSLSDHHMSFGAGDTDMSAPDNNSSSDGGPSW